MRRSTCANGFIGGADTTVSSVTSFFMAMAIYPDVQKKAQVELDRVLALDENGKKKEEIRAEMTERLDCVP
ncbi:hypothetical protein AGABI2DRAFT_121773 [Agaricus bisporus var. bisporus H97]|uniref:hypothetical protein n=1 Tax=Agaricus bisporus var. bisporus (strain H97 / ATCC MYA-4626 / FGSC 10389) TaxID=936046 RepID=UPI00029F57B7|nr:hypothetical protein AGABI2DRAFT_121773 [Agaricus bisporus var. bisporus H97]EKV43631.1 hypothetical protein AGABI2DRAFT_121773 [Agaricus bisporus var. bisporus H97]